MTTEPSARPPAPTARARRTGWPLLAGVAVVLVAAMAAAWLLRGPIGARLVVDYLRRQGVPAAVTFDRLGPSGFTGKMRLGPAADPDLVVDHVEVAFEPGVDWRRGLTIPRIRSVTLVRPQIKLAWDGRRLRYGSLQRLVDDLLAHPAAAGPPPAIDARAATLRLATPAGRLVTQGDLRLDDGRINYLSARLAPATLSQADWRAELSGGTLLLRGTPERLDGEWQLGVQRFRRGTVSVKAATLGGRISAPDPQIGAPVIDGPVSVELDGAAAEVAEGVQQFTGATARFSFAGRAKGGTGGLAGQGRLLASLGATGLASGQVRAAGLSATADLPTGAFAVRPDGLRLSGPLTASLSTGRATWTTRSGAVGVSQASWRGRGELALGSSEVAARLRGAAKARGGATDLRLARGLAAAAPIDPRAREALARAISQADFSAPDLQLALSGSNVRIVAYAPLRVAAPGASVVLTPRGSGLLYASTDDALVAFDLAVRGAALPSLDLAVNRLRLAPDGAVDAALDFRLDLDMPPLRGAHLAGGGRLQSVGGTVRFTARPCLKVTAAAFGEPDPLAANLQSEICPSGDAPMLVADGRGWSLRALARGARLDAPKVEVEVRDGSGRVDLRGTAGGPIAGTVTVERATAVDAAAMARFRPLRGSGRLTAAGDVWDGTFDVAEAAHGRPLGKVDVRQSVTAGAGEARIHAPDLVFATDGLQPGDIFPMAGDLARQAAGRAAFEGEARWTEADLTSSGRLQAEDLSFHSMFGQVSGVRAKVAFTSLAPLITAPEQTVTAARLNSLTTLTDLRATYALDAEALSLQSGEATAAGGRLVLGPMRLPYAGDRTAAGEVRFTGVDLGGLIAATSLADQLTVQAKVDGDLAFTAGPEGFAIRGGRVFATAPGRLSFRRGALGDAVATGGAALPSAPGAPIPVAPPQGAMTDIAYQALEDLAFETLEATLEPRDKGRLGAIFHIKGRHDPPVDPKPRISILDILRGKAFEQAIPLPKGTPINLTLDTSLNFDELMKAYIAAISGGGSAQVQP